MSILQECYFVGQRIRRASLLRRHDWFWKRLARAWHAVSLQIYRRRGVWTHINGDVFRFDPAFGSPLGRHDPRTHEPELYRAFTDAIRPGMRVFDVGAHIGIFALGAAARIRDGRVYAFEPLPETAAALRHHILLNRYDDRVSVVEAAVSDGDGPIRLYASGVSTMASLGRENPLMLSRSTLDQPIRELEVLSVTLDAFCDRSKVVPDVLKIDAEGAELRVLRGARHLLVNEAPLIFCEIHPRQLRNCGSSLAELEGFLAGIDYVLEPITAPDAAGIFHCVVRRRERR